MVQSDSNYTKKIHIFKKIKTQTCVLLTKIIGVQDTSNTLKINIATSDKLKKIIIFVGQCYSRYE